MIYGIGETVLDILFRNDQPEKAIPGGSTFNAMISLGRCETDCTMITQTGDDHVGDMTLAYLRDNGVNTERVSVVPGMKSHVSLAFLDEHSDAHYSFYKDHNGWRIDLLQKAIEDIRFTDKDVLLLGSFFAVNPVVRPVVEKLLFAARAAKAMVYYDINYRQPHAAQLEEVRDLMAENMILSSVVRGSIDDFRIVFGLEDPDAIYERVEPLCKTLIITDGAKPIRIYSEQAKLVMPTPVITPVSTVGAGDNFNAGFVYYYSQAGMTSDSRRWTERQLLNMARTGQEFGQEVCLSWENSISK